MTAATTNATTADTPKVLLDVNGIEVIYNHVILVLKGVSLQVPEGKIVALLGANGAGKTTTLRAISNLLKGERGDVTKGHIQYRDQRIEKLSPAELVKRGVVQVMEGRHCFAHLTIEENLLTGAYTRDLGRGDTSAALERVYQYFPRLKQRRSSPVSYTHLDVYKRQTVNHPESPDTVSIDMRDIGPTYYFAPPRVLEGLLTHVMIRMEDAGYLKRKLFHACMKLARRVGTRILDGESVNAWDRLRYALGNVMIYGPLRNALGMSRVRVAYTAGEAIGPDLFVFYRSIGINLKQLYGSTETSVFVCVQPDGQVRDDTVGPPVPGVEIRVADNGEILVKSPGLFKEYYRNPDATQEARSADGWFHTGDAGYLDTDGQLKIIDRAKDVGKLADGSLFAPKYLENKLKFFPHIKEAVAFGAGRQDVCAFINIDLEAVGNWAERRGLPYAGYTDLAGKDEVYQLIADCVEQVNADLATDPKLSASQISRFLILHKELDPDDDELTRTRKVRRAFIAQKYGVLIDALFEGKQSQFIETEVKFEDGRSGKISADLRIHPVKTFPAITARAA